MMAGSFGDSDLNSSTFLWNDFESSQSSANSQYILSPVHHSTPQTNRESRVLNLTSELNTSLAFDDMESEISSLSTQSTVIQPLYHSTPQPNRRRRPRALTCLSCELSDSIVFLDDDMDSEFSSLSTQSQPLTTPFTGNSQLSSSQSTAIQLIGFTCCESRCLASFNLLEVESIKTNFERRKNIEQQQFLLDTIRLTASQCGDNLQLHHNLTISGKHVCKVAFTKLLGISQQRFRNACNLYLEGAIVSRKKSRLEPHKSTKYSTAVAWMKRYFDRIGDKMPHIEQIHLPHFLSKKIVYELMIQDLKHEGLGKESIISSSHFYLLWKDEFRNCIIPKQSLFSKCDICVRFTSERLKVAGDKFKTEQLKKEYKEHLDLVEFERRKYYYHREKSRSEPNKYITIIIDGMDQNKTNVPNISQPSKSTSSLWKVRTHLTGALVHTKMEKGKLVFAFFDLLQWPHDSNLTISILLAVLVQVQTKLHILPEVLYLQLDNTCRENKNKYVFSFLALLVQLKIFKKIRVNFLPVGHTHEDVDQFFSKVSTNLKRTGAETIKELMMTTALSFTPQPVTVLLEHIHDVRCWLVPHIENLHGHSQPHCFKFTLEDGIALMYYKNWSKDIWSTEGLKLLKDIPLGAPSICIPTPEKQDTDQLLLDIPKWKPWLTKKSWEEWALFLESGIKKLSEIPVDPPEWPLELLSELTMQQQSESHEDNSSSLLLIGERQECMVYTGPRKTVVSNDAELSTLKVDDLVAVVCENYLKEPVIACCTKIFEENIEVKWMEGSYETSWKLWKVRDDRNRRKLVEWTDTVPKLSVVLFGFSLTSKNRLQKRTVEHLKREYARVKVNNFTPDQTTNINVNC